MGDVARMKRAAQPVERVKAADASSANKRAVRATIVGVTKQAELAGRSQEITDNPFSAMEAAGEVLTPPYDLLSLSQLEENSSELGPVVGAMTTNVVGFGWSIKPTVNILKSTDPQLAKAVHTESLQLNNFFRNCGYNRRSFTSVRKDTRKDLELTGNAWWELIRNGQEKLDQVNHLPSHTMRLTKCEAEAILVDENRLIQTEDGTWKYEAVKVWKRFRKFVQIREGRKAWFKEWGDPRIYDVESGMEKDNSWPKEKRANEAIHFKLYCARSPYGLPRYIGNLFSIFGSRAAEEINYVTLKNNNIPSMVVMVSNGVLTQASIDRITQFVEEQIQGQSNYSRFLILEAESAMDMPDITGSGTMKLDIKPLKDQQVQDAMFQNYDKNNANKVRASFRLSAMYLGISEDIAQATAKQVRKDTEEQVFAPERAEDDWIINSTIMVELKALYHRFVTNTPNVTDDESLIKIMSAAERSGGMTPRIARQVVEDIMGQRLGNVDDELGPEADVPFTILVARAAQKTSPVNLGTTVGLGRQVGVDQVNKSDFSPLVANLMLLREAIEGELALRMGEVYVAEDEGPPK